MANPEHLKILRKGVEVWNVWREEHPNVEWPNLEGAILEGANLEGANLLRTIFREANLEGVNLEGANLREADLVDASLQGASLSRADLVGADLTGANLRRTNLESARLECGVLVRANLKGAELKGALLEGTNFQGALLEGTNFQGADPGAYNESGHFKRADDGSYWEIRQGHETLQEALLRQAAEQATENVTIEFTQAVWRELHVVEIGLREALGDGRFTVKKADGRLAVTFKSPEDLQRGLEAVVVQLAALESVEPQQVKSMTVRPLKSEIIILDPEEMKLDAVVAELREIKRRLPPDLDDNEATAAKMWDRIPILNLFTHRFEKWLASYRGREVTQCRIDPLQLYSWAWERFEMFRKQHALPRPMPGREQRALSPGEEPKDESHSRGALQDGRPHPGLVNDAIRLHDKILLCCSQASLESWWVKDEIRKAQERERREGRDIIIPLMIDRYLLDGWEDGLAADLRSRLAADFTGWEHNNAKFEEQFERVTRALKTDECARRAELAEVKFRGKET